jgi:hypothetical protein
LSKSKYPETKGVCGLIPGKVKIFEVGL